MVYHAPQQHPYAGLWAAVATMHSKERAIAPPLCQWFGMTVTAVPGIDTDALGTFTGEIPRAGSMLDAARSKALLAIERTGAPLGIGSEGAFGPDPLMPFLASGHEILVLREKVSGHEIVVNRRTRTNYDHLTVAPYDLIDTFLARIGFPDHAVAVRADPHEGRGSMKGLNSRNSVDAALRLVFDQAMKATIQTDMRAHLNPTRMASIARLARRLALRIARLCPICTKPGFGLVDIERGLPCTDCGAATNLIRAEIHGCTACGHKLARRVRAPSLKADPTWCENCNP